MTRDASPLAADQSQLRTILDAVLDFVFVLDAQGCLLYANRAVAERLGYAPEEMVGRSAFDFVASHDRPRAAVALQDAVGGDEGLFATFMASKDDTVVPIEMTVALGHWGGRDALFGVARDVTARWRAQETQRAMVRGLQSVIEAADELIACRDLDALLRRAVELGREKVGFERCSIFLIDETGTHGTYGTDLQGCTTDECHVRFGPEHGSRAEEVFAAAGGRSRWIAVEGPLRDCAEARVAEVGHGWTAVTAIGSADRACGVLYNDTAISHAPLSTTQQEIGAVYCSLLGTLIGRMRAEDALRRSEARFRIAAETASDVIWEADPANDRVEWSERIDGLLDYPPGGVPRTISGCLPLVHPEDLPRLQDTIKSCSKEGRPFAEEFRVFACDGSVRYWAVRAASLSGEGDGQPRWVGMISDLTEHTRAEQERSLLEARILYAQKLESLGVLAGGVAHDFNNLLVGVLGNVSLAQNRLPPDSPAHGHLDQARSAAVRAADLADQMLAYSGKGAFVVEPLNLSELVGEMTDLLGASVSKKAVLTHCLADDLQPIQGDATQLRQVIMNLIVNASEAIGDRDGAITVATSTIDADRRTLADTYPGDDLPAGRYVSLEVSDNGCGMDDETRARVFDPFFTTKAVGRGLGLAAVLGIVRGHRGAIVVSGRPGEGTTVRALFPTMAAEFVRPRPAAGAFRAQPRLPGGTVLVADDEVIVRSVAKIALEESGFEVLLARDGQQALDLFQARPDDITAVVLDLTMPRMSGDEVLRAIRTVRPDLRVILSSGYSEEHAVSRLAERGDTHFIRKPYDPQRLVQMLCED